jgi:hypothetical protein
VSEWRARVKNLFRAERADDLLSSLPMTLLPSSETPRRRRAVLVVAALASVALVGVTGYVLLAAPGRLLASQVSPNGPGSLPALGADGQPLPLSTLVTAEGRVVDREGKPLRNVSVRSGAIESLTDADGHFSIGLVGADHSVLVKLPGYQKRWVALDQSKPTVTLSPHTVKAAYLTYYGVADKGIRERVFSLLDRTELNSVVIDVKGDRGLIPYRTTVPAALEAGALGPVIMKDFDQLLAELKGRHVYTIARIVAFKDNILANAHPELAVIDTRTGKPWIDNEKLAWVDPTREEVWDYLIAVAKEAALKGFDEIQFDYVRFPTDGKLAAAKYSKPITPQVRIETISGFLAKARKVLGPTGVFIAADVFGYTAFNDNDTDIGQRIEDMAPHLDYFSPMVYPSGYHRGIPGFRNPVSHSYEIVRDCVRLTRKRTEGMPVQVRPWLQDFRDYAFDKRIFGVGEIQAQVRGAEEAGATGWMLWNPRNDYTAAALRPAPVLAKKTVAQP